MFERRGMFERQEPTKFQPPVQPPKKLLLQRIKESFAGLKEKKPKAMLTLSLIVLALVVIIYNFVYLIDGWVDNNACEKQAQIPNMSISCFSTPYSTLTWGKDITCYCYAENNETNRHMEFTIGNVQNNASINQS